LTAKQNPLLRCRKLHIFLLELLLSCLFTSFILEAQQISPVSNQSNPRFGYLDKGDSIEFIFGQQQKIRVGGVEVVLQDRINEIKQVNLAGDFNAWNPNSTKYELTKVGDKLFKITISKASLGKKGELKQFKYVLNHKYWVEPPAEAVNKYTGKDGNTNLTLQL
jgi:hypothetical protein